MLSVVRDSPQRSLMFTHMSLARRATTRFRSHGE